MYDKRWAEEPEVGAAGPKAVGRSRLRRQPYTILRYRRLVAEKFDGSQHGGIQASRGSPEVEGLVVRMATRKYRPGL
jgi:hypothetical protein